MAFYGERLQESRFKVSQEALRPYFPLPKVLDGLFALVLRLYGIHVRERPAVGVWHPSVRYYDLLDQENRVVAGFLPGSVLAHEKRSGAWMDECIVAKTLPSGTALPVAQLVCNFTAPVGNAASLLTHDEVTTLFHEFGHGLHHMLTRVAYPSIAGINGVAWDAVELPSQFMENFVWRPEVLPLISAHVDTGEPLPVTCCSACWARVRSMRRSIRCAKSSLRPSISSCMPTSIRSSAPRWRRRWRRCGRKVAVVPAAPFNRMPSSFAHIFSRRLCGGLLQLQVGRSTGRRRLRSLRRSRRLRQRHRGRFRDSILARGGSLDAMDAFVRFRGREPDVRPLLKQTGIAA